MAATWFVRQDGKVFGPFDSGRLKQLATAGKIAAHTDIAQAKDGPWVAAATVKGLMAQPDQPATPTALPASAMAQRPSSSDSSGLPRTSPASPAVTFAPPPLPATAPTASSNVEQGIRREKIKTYFDVPGVGCAYFTVLIGIAVLVSSLAKGGETIAGGILIAVFFTAGGLLILKKNREKASEEELEQWLEDDLRNLTRLSLPKVGLPRSAMIREPVVVTGPTVSKVAGVKKWSKKGRDGILRFSPVAVTVINFTKDQLVAYSCVLDLVTGKPHSESTDEFFYKDIVAVTTKKESKKMNVDGTEIQMSAAETFAVTTSGGNELSVFLTDPAVVAKMGGGEIPTKRAEMALEVVRTVLREKKHA